MEAAIGVVKYAPREHYYLLSQEIAYVFRTMRREKVFTFIAVSALLAEERSHECERCTHECVRHLALVNAESSEHHGQLSACSGLLQALSNSTAISMNSVRLDSPATEIKCDC